MTLSSMTGFARADAVSGAYVVSWELRSVNAKGLDVRLRIPPGWDALEAPVRARTAASVVRGTLHATLNVRREGVAPTVRVNEPVLGAVLSAMRDVAHRVHASPPSLDGILALQGVIEIIDQDESEDERRAAEVAVLDAYGRALAELVQMRRHEGEALVAVLAARLDEIAALTARAEAAPGRQPEAIRARLVEQIASLLQSSERFDPDRLHQEAILLAAKADVREELDRLAAHAGQARKLMQSGQAVGRKLDFIAQELNREANTICAKSNDVELTNIGLELKSVVEQFREQVQNLE